MERMYLPETFRRRYLNGIILVENRTPVFRDNERAAVKREIEDKLFRVFFKYAENDS